jgi:hypothetical protein
VRDTDAEALSLARWVERNGAEKVALFSAKNVCLTDTSHCGVGNGGSVQRTSARMKTVLCIFDSILDILAV